MFTATADAIFTWMSPSIRDVLEWEPEDMVGYRPPDFVHPDDQAGLFAQMNAVGAGTPVDFRQRMRTKDGTYRWIGVAVEPVVDARGNVIRRVGNFRDISEHVAAEQALVNSAREYQEIVENITDIVVRGADGIIQWISPSVRIVLGWDPEDLQGKPSLDLVHPMDRKLFLDETAKAESDAGIRIQARFATRTGGYRCMSITTGQVFTDQAADTWVSVWRDVTTEHQALSDLSDLAASEKRLRQTLDGAPIGMSLVTPNGNYISANPAMCRVLGRTEAEITSGRWLDFTHPDDVESGVMRVAEIIARRWESFKLLKRYLRPDGTVVWCDLSVSCVRADDGRVQYFIAQAVDVTESVNAQNDLAASERQHRELLHSLSDVVFTKGPDDRISFVSASVTDLLGWDPDDLIGTAALELVHPEDRASLTLPLAELESTGTSTARTRVRCKNGDYRWVESTGQVQRDPDGTPVGAIGVWRDANVAIQRELEASFETARLSTITDHLGDIVIRLQYGVISWVSPSITDQLGGAVEEWIGIRLRDRVHPEDRAEFRYARRLTSAGESATARLRIQDFGGDYRWLGGVLTPTGGGDSDDIIVSFRVVDEDVAREAALEELATSDTLTGLANRRALRQHLHTLLDKQRHSDNVAVLFCDLDNLKQINDTLGHPAGDAVLTTVADRLRARLRHEDLSARIGGDEFVIALAGIVDVEQALQAAENLREEIAAPIDVPSAPGVIATLSIGVALGRPGDDPNELLGRADEAMYEAKGAGGHRVVVAD